MARNLPSGLYDNNKVKKHCCIIVKHYPLRGEPVERVLYNDEYHAHNMAKIFKAAFELSELSEGKGDYFYLNKHTVFSEKGNINTDWMDTKMIEIYGGSV